jgi:transcription antitermination factor NusG
MGYEVYLPVQEVVSVWKDGRRKLRERIVLPNLLFVRLTELERKEVVAFPFVKRFMVDRAGQTDAYNRHPLAVIPDEQMERFKFMLGQNEMEIFMEPLALKIGDAVRIIRGSLVGLEGHVYQGNAGKSCVAVKLDFLGCAIAEVALSDIELIQQS